MNSREGLFCDKCNKETYHHYFMMMPVGYMVCDICSNVYSKKEEST